MNSIYIYHHLGLGDHILCNGLVRYFAELYERVYLFAKTHNLKNVSYMYRDLQNLKFIPMDNSEVNFFMKVSPNNNYLIIGHEELHKKLKTENKTFDEIFYEMANLPFEDKWDKFYFQRNLEKEKDVYYNKLKLKDREEYLFVHDDQKTGRLIKSAYLSKKIKIINPADFKNIGIFDFIYTIEKAREVHVMDSSFSCLIDTMKIQKENLFMHFYVRTDNSPSPKFKLNWTIIK